MLIVNILTTIRYIKTHAPRKAYLFAWGPLLPVVVVLAVKDIRQAIYEYHHPNISEMYINLLGKSLWLDYEIEAMLPSTSNSFVEVTRFRVLYPDADKVNAYCDARLANTFTSMMLYAGETESAENRPPLSLPVIQPKSSPRNSQFYSQDGRSRSSPLQLD